MAKLTIKKVNEDAEKYNYEVLKLFRNDKNDPMVTVKCKNNHIHSLAWRTFKKEHGCNECRRKYSKEFIIEYITQYNYKIQSFENFHDLNSKLNFICKNEHITETTFNNFKKGRRCPCEGGIKLYTEEEIEKIFTDNNCILLDKYEKQLQVVNYICSCGNKSKIRIKHFLDGIRCGKCAQEKRKQTLYENGTAPCSKQQKYLHNLLGGELNYPVRNLSLDIAFPEHKIYMEYNGSGHDLQIKFGNMTEDEFNNYENNRYLFLSNLSFKCIYILSKNDKLPSNEILESMKNYAFNFLLSNKDFFIKFDIDNSKIITYKNEINYDFGKLRKIAISDIN